MADQAIPPAEAGAEGGGGGSAVDALMSLEKGLSSVAEAAGRDPQFPEEAKAAFASALDAFRQGLEILSGGGAPSGPVAMEAGASGARPVSPGGPR
jgi:hypothetical protein